MLGGQAGKYAEETGEADAPIILHQLDCKPCTIAIIVGDICLLAGLQVLLRLQCLMGIHCYAYM